MSAATAYSKNNGFHKSSKTPWGNPVVYFFSLVLVAICVVPVLYIIFGGFRTNAQITNNPAGLPNPWVISNYKEVITSDIFWTELVNSLIVGICTMVGVVVLGIMVSYVIARYRFRYSALMYALFSAGLMFPMTVGITPLYLMIRNLGLSNSLAGIILPQIAFGLPQTIIILVPFLQSIPMELEEACLLDGCSRLGFFWRMVIPLSMPGVSTMATYMVREGRGAGNYGYGSAVALIIFVISLIVALTYQHFVLNRDLDGALTEKKASKKRKKRQTAEDEALAVAMEGVK